MLDLNRLTAFVVLVDSGSFTAAGKALGRTKAAVSLQVQKLEADLGATLLVRNSRHVALTEAGERLYQAANPLLAEAARVEAITKPGAELSGTLRLSTTNEYLARVLAPHLASFLALHPRLRIEAWGAPGTTDLVAERFDLAVRVGRGGNATLRTTRLTSFELVPVAAPGFASPESPGDLAKLPWARHRQHPRPVTFRRGAEIAEVSLDGRFVSDAVDANRRLAVDGIAAALAAEWAVAEDLAVGRLVRLIPEWSGPRIPIQAVMPGTRHPPARVRALVAHLRAVL